MSPISETSSTCSLIGMSLNSFLLSSNHATVAWLNAPIAVKLADVTLFCFANSVSPDMTSSFLDSTIAYCFTPPCSASNRTLMPGAFPVGIGAVGEMYFCSWVPVGGCALVCVTIVKRASGKRRSWVNRLAYPFIIFSSGCAYERRLRFVDAFNFRDVLLSQLEICCAGVLFYLLRAACADNGGGHCRMAQHPCNGDLARRPAISLTDSSQALNECEVLRKLGLKKFRVAAAPITVGQLRYPLASHGAGQQTGLHWRIDYHANSLRVAVGNVLRFNFTPDQ